MQPVNYNEIWSKKWGDMARYGPIHRHHRRLIGALLRDRQIDSVLDIGCGEGTKLDYACHLFPNIRRVYGFDISPVALQRAQKILPQGQFVAGDIETQPPPFSADLVMCLEVLEHLPNDVQALQNIRMATQKYLLVSTLQGRMRDFERDIGHVRNYQEGELEHKITSCGFRIIAKKIWEFPLYSPLYRNILNNQVSQQVTFGSYGIARKMLCTIMYWLFMLNSETKGDIIIVLAEPDIF